MAEDQYVGRLVPHMEVCDVLGFKIGSIARVYRDEYAALSPVGAHTGHIDGRPRRPGVLEVKTGLLGLGPHLYVPDTAIREVTEVSVFLDQNKEDVLKEWRSKPEYLDELQ